MVVCKADVILPADLPQAVRNGGVAPPVVRPAVSCPAASLTGGAVPAPAAQAESDFASLARGLFQLARTQSKLRIIPAVEKELIIQALTATQGNQVQAARLLGITRATLRKRIDKFGIRKETAIM